MNASFVRSLIALAWLAAFGPGAWAAVTFSLTPNTVSNTYPGQITFQASGLATGGTVVVQKFLDANTNGVIDGGDWLVQQFTLTDGQAGMVIGGVTNFNVPGDMDGASNGQITAKWNFQNGDFMQNIVGKFIYKFSGNFSPSVTTNFTVTNFPWAHAFTGNVVSNGTSSTVSNAVVFLLAPGGHSSPIEGTVANNAGYYSLPAPAGTYSLIAFRSNYVCNFGNPPVITLGGANVTTNLTVTNATASLSGSVVDANNSSLGLPGLLISAQATNGLMGIGFTDTNGNFSIRVPAGQCALQADDTTLVVHGYLGMQNRTNVNAGATGITLAVPKATALVYGSVKDNLGNPFVAMDAYASDNNNNYQTDGYTDMNGNYVLGVLGYGSSDSWWMQANGNNQITNYVFSQETINGNISSNTVVQQNFIAILATNFITGWLKDSGGNPISGVGISANATINNTNYQSSTAHTDSNGNYLLNVANSNSWWVSVNTGGGDDSLPSNYFGPPSKTVGITNNNGVANFTALIPTNFITGTLRDNTGSAVSNVWIWAYTVSGTYYQTGANTDGTGHYSIGVLNSNVWEVGINTGGGSGNLPGNYLNPGSQTVGVTNNSVVVNFTVLLATNFITGNVQQSTGPNIAGVGVYASTTINGTNYQSYADTDANGHYSLNVANGSWNVGLNTGGGSDSLDNILGGGTYQNPAGQNINITNNNAVVNFTVQPCGGVQILTTSLPSGQVNSYYDQYLEASSCGSSFTWSVVSNSLPPGLTGDPASGEIYGTPTNSGTYIFTVQVTDGNSLTNQTLSLYIAPASVAALQVTTASLNNGTKNVFYSQQLAAANGTPPYTWSLGPGSASLPTGLSLTTNGILSGTPTATGTFYFYVQVADSMAATAENLLSLTIVGTSSNNVTLVLKSDAATLAAALGSAAPSGSLLTLLDSGNVLGLNLQADLVGAYGTYTPIPSGAPSGTQVVNIPPGDGESGFFKVSFILPAGYQNIQLTGAANVDDYGRAFLNGNPISSSLTANDSGRITETGNTQFSTANTAFFHAGTNDLVIADDNTSGPSGAAFYATVSYQYNSPLQVNTTNLPNATQNAAYTTTLAASGGQPPYAWSLAPGSASLPNGLSLATNGVISGTPGGSGTSLFIVQATDASPTIVYQLLSLTVNTSSIPPVIVLTAPVKLATGQFQFTFKVISGTTYTIQYSTDLKTWTNYETFDFSNNNSNAGGHETISLPIATGASRCFYRVKVGS